MREIYEVYTEIYEVYTEIYEVYTEEDGGTETQRREKKREEREMQINRRTD